jgi:hypothetical protein
MNASSSALSADGSAVEHILEAAHVGDLTLKGFARPMAAYNLLGLRRTV